MDKALWTIFVIFMASAAIQLFYTWMFFSRIAFSRKKKGNPGSVPVSVVIAARNEYDNLINNLPPILEQDYPEFEVVLVNDASDDETLTLLDEFRDKYKHLKIVNLPENLNFFKGKKFPLSMGIKSAKYEHLLLTDADCRPRSERWIAAMAGNYQENIEIVVGYGAYRSEKGILDKLVRFEALHVAVQYLSFAMAGLPYMGVGRNLSYQRSLFYRNKGFSSHYRVSSGDDDLFINKVATRMNTAVEISADSHTLSRQPSSFAAFLRQKKRHLSTAGHYKFRFKALLGLYSVSQFFFWISFIILLIFGYNILFLLSLWALRVFSQMIILKSSMIRLKEKKLLLFSPLLEFIFIFINPLLAFSNLIYKQDKWK